MEQQDDLNCNICYRLAKEAVQCEQSKCHKLYCKTCYTFIVNQMKKQEKELKCPFCRVQNFTVISSPLREQINNKLIKCKFCLKPWKFKSIDLHQSQCDQKKINCQFCQHPFKRKDIVQHTKTVHQDKINKILQVYQTSKYPVWDPNIVIKNQAIKMKYEETPHIGVTGKFYCNGTLGLPKCICCNGKCGPTNGQNCQKCMHLDMVRRGLTKGYLVNANGEVCWLDPFEHFACGVMFSMDQKACGKQGYCMWCNNIQKTRLRYASLM